MIYYAAKCPVRVEESSDDEDDLLCSKDEPMWSSGIWCPISKRYHDGEAIKAAHIVSHAIGETSCSYLFGEETKNGHLMNPKNGILIYYSFEQALSKA